MKHNDHYNKMQAEHTAWMTLCERIKVMSGGLFSPLRNLPREIQDSPAKSNKGLETMPPHIIYQFSPQSGEGEFLVISDLPRDEVLEEHLTPGYDLDEEHTIDEDATHLPCDQKLFTIEVQFSPLLTQGIRNMKDPQVGDRVQITRGVHSGLLGKIIGEDKGVMFNVFSILLNNDPNAYSPLHSVRRSDFTLIEE